MGVITLDLPIVGQPNTTEDVKVRNNFQTLQATLNGNIDASNLSPIVLSQLGNFKQALSAIQSMMLLVMQGTLQTRVQLLLILE
jgi:hypothetical protein